MPLKGVYHRGVTLGELINLITGLSVGMPVPIINVMPLRKRAVIIFLIGIVT